MEDRLQELGREACEQRYWLREIINRLDMIIFTAARREIFREPHFKVYLFSKNISIDFGLK